MCCLIHQSIHQVAENAGTGDSLRCPVIGVADIIVALDECPFQGDRDILQPQHQRKSIAWEGHGRLQGDQGRGRLGRTIHASGFLRFCTRGCHLP